MSCTAVGIIKALVDQLLDQHPYMLPPFHTRRSTSGEPVLRSYSMAAKMLNDICITLPKTYIIIDGLDECGQPERKQTLETLMEIVSRCDVIEAGKLRLLVVSQEYVDIRRAFFGSGALKLAPKVLHVSHEDNGGDIHVYVGSWVGKIAFKYDLEKDITEYLVNLTEANAKGQNHFNLQFQRLLTVIIGMFLFAKLVMRNLYEQPTRESLLDAIKNGNFPTGLRDA